MGAAALGGCLGEVRPARMLSGEPPEKCKPQRRKRAPANDFFGWGQSPPHRRVEHATTPFEAKFPPSCSEAKIKGKTGVSKGVVARSARRCGPLFWRCVGVQPKRCQRAPLKASSQKGNPWVYWVSRYTSSVRGLGSYRVPRGCTEKAARHKLSARELGTCHCREYVPRTCAQKQRLLGGILLGVSGGLPPEQGHWG